MCELKFSAFFRTFRFIMQSLQKTIHGYNPDSKSANDLHKLLRFMSTESHNSAISPVLVAVTNNTWLNYFFVMKYLVILKSYTVRWETIQF